MNALIYFDVHMADDTIEPAGIALKHIEAVRYLDNYTSKLVICDERKHVITVTGCVRECVKAINRISQTLN